MKKTNNKFKFFSSLLVTMLTVGMINLALVNAQAPDVVFNNGVGIDGIGDERDFLRINDANGGNTATACTTGQKVNLWFYVHNTNPTFMNGTNFDGLGVARNTKVDIDFNNPGYVNSHEIEATVKAENSALATDKAYIDCGSSKIAIKYVSQSLQTNAPASSSPYTLTGNIMDNATLGYNGGVVPGCFEYRAYITVTVEITVKPPTPVVSKQCTLADPKRITRNKYEITANATVQNTTVQSYTFTVKNAANAVVDTKVFNTTALSQTYNFEQATPGTYTVSAVIMTADGKADGECVKTVKVEEEPKTPAYSCDMFTLSFVDRKANVSFKPVALNGATFKDATIKYNADGSTRETVTTNALNSEGKIVSSYTFAEGSKNVEAVATVRFNVPEGNTTVVKDVLCKDAKVLGVKTPPTPEKPKTLPATGAGSIVGLMALVTVAGAAMHRQLTLKRNR